MKNKRKKNIIFCAYIDKFYLIKGIAMCLSLIKNKPDVNLWVLCLDDYTEKTFKILALKNTTLISLSEFETNELKMIKKYRLPVEYYWTCTPFLPLYIFQKDKNCTHVAYVDGDIFFYSSLDNLIAELGDASLYLIPHRFPKDEKDKEKSSGKFNAAFVIFKRDNIGLACLNNWGKQCLQWCYWFEEKGKMGNQMYLNNWPKLYNKIIISRNLGIDAAPWNINQYSITKKGVNVFIDGDRLIFYHFHEFKVLGKDKFSLCSRFIIPRYEYKLSPQVRKYIYDPYVRKIKEALEKVLQVDQKFNYFEKRKLIALPNIKPLLVK